MPDDQDTSFGTRPVILVHSSVAGARQWRTLIEDHGARFDFLAPDLHGYGRTAPWAGDRPLRLDDCADLVLAALDGWLGERAEAAPADCRFDLVGHSFGGSVALKVAERAAGRVGRLVLIEPNPFHLLAEAGRTEAYAEARALGDTIARSAETGNWHEAAAVFADYWQGKGNWAKMPPAHRARFAEALRPNLHEWDAVLGETTPLASWHRAGPAETTVIRAPDTVRTIREIVEVLREGCPGWRFVRLRTGGHLAPMTHPQATNRAILAALA